MNFVKDPKPGKCCVKRCMQKPELYCEGQPNRQFCDRHATELYNMPGGPKINGVRIRFRLLEQADEKPKATASRPNGAKKRRPNGAKKRRPNGAKKGKRVATPWPYDPYKKTVKSLDGRDTAQIRRYSTKGLDPSEISIRMGVGVSVVKRIVKSQW